MLQCANRTKNTLPTSVFVVWLSRQKLKRRHPRRLGKRPHRRQLASKDRAKRRMMRHRSNQALASQVRNPDPPEDDAPPPRRRLLIGWGTAIAALTVSTAALALIIWLARFPVAQFFLSSALAERGVEADFQVGELDLSHAVLHGVRVGAADASDVSIATLIATWGWNGLAPQLQSVRLLEA